MESTKIGTIVYYGETPHSVLRIVVSVFSGRELIARRTWTGQDHLLKDEAVSKEIGEYLISHGVERVVLNDDVLPLESE